MTENTDSAQVVISCGQQTLALSKESAKLSNVWSAMIDEDDEEDTQIPLTEGSNIAFATLQWVAEWCTFHSTHPLSTIEKPLRSPQLSECGVQEWDEQFIDKPQEDVFNLIKAANFLDIQGLLDLACAKIASLIRGKSPEEIRQTFNITNDYTPEEEAAVLEENAWCLRET